MVNKKTDEVSDSKAASEADVVDAVIVEESDSGPSSSPEAEPIKTVEQVQEIKPKTSKAGWIFSGLLTAFIGGVFAAPYGEAGLRSLGILAPSENNAASTGPDQLTATRQTNFESQLSDLGTSISRLQEILAQQSEQISEAAAARKKIGDDVALLASQPGRVADGEGTQVQNLQRVETQLAAITAEMARLAALSGTADPQVTGLAGSIALARAETNQLKAQLTVLQSAMEQIQVGSLDVSPRGRLLLALGRLKDEALSGAPLGGDLDAIRLDIAELPALDQQMIGADVATLTANRQGIETFDTLARSFGDIANAAKKAEEKASGSFLASLFTVRRTDANAVGIDAVLLIVEKRLTLRDLSGAVEALDQLSGDAAVAVADWKQKAIVHRDVIAAFDRLLRTISAAVTGGSR